MRSAAEIANFERLMGECRSEMYKAFARLTTDDLLSLASQCNRAVFGGLEAQTTTLAQFAAWNPGAVLGCLCQGVLETVVHREVAKSENEP